MKVRAMISRIPGATNRACAHTLEQIVRANRHGGLWHADSAGGLKRAAAPGKQLARKAMLAHPRYVPEPVQLAIL